MAELLGKLILETYVDTDADVHFNDAYYLHTFQAGFP